MNNQVQRPQLVSIKRASALLIVLVAAILPACAEDIIPPERVVDDSMYSAVGRLSVGAADCSAVLLEHGLIATAKHCFIETLRDEESGLQGLRVRFGQHVGVEESDDDVVVMGEALTSLSFGGPTSDVALIRYDPNVTEDAFFSDLVPAALEPAAERTQLHVVGFPAHVWHGGKRARIISRGCEATDEVGEVEGFDGTLFGTTCRGWFGNSGGPVYALRDGVPVSVLGVVSHTFVEETVDGRLVPLGWDDYGDWVTINYSPLGSFSPLSDIFQSTE